jgi:transposase
MLTLPKSIRIFLCTTRVDMRKSFDGLSILAREVLQQNPQSGHLFVFVGKRADRMKILWWDGDGWALYCKRLEQGVFKIPKMDTDHVRCEIGAAQLSMIFEGIEARSIRQLKRWNPNSANKTSS